MKVIEVREFVYVAPHWIAIWCEVGGSEARRTPVEGVELHPGRWRVEVCGGVIVDAVEIDEGGAR